MSKFDSIETIVNTDLSDLAKSKLENQTKKSSGGNGDIPGDDVQSSSQSAKLAASFTER